MIMTSFAARNYVDKQLVLAAVDAAVDADAAVAGNRTVRSNDINTTSEVLSDRCVQRLTKDGWGG